MPFTVQLGLLLALATAFVSILGFLYKYRGAVEAPAVEWRHPVRSTMALFQSKWWTLGIIVATSSWFLHVAALSLAPISLVQSVIAGGLVMLTVVAERMFGIGVTKREWIGVALTAAGLAFLAATLGDTGDGKHSDYETGTLAIYVGGLALISLAPMVYAMGGRAHAGVLLAASAGMQWGASDVAIKAASGGFGDDGIVATFFGPLTIVITVLSLVGLVVSARSLQIGDAVPVIAITSAAANLCTIASGLIVFGEPLPEGDLNVVLRMLAFALVVTAAALTPGPVGAAERSAV
ncbi:MAG TPA: DMT family transporter [Solirubrobacteraceae bacterium]